MRLTEVLGGIYVMITEEENDLVVKYFSENEYVNETTNKYWSLFDDKISQYNYVFSIFPRLKFKRLNYLKKIKKEKKTKEDKLFIPEFFSEREYKQLVELDKLVSK